MPGSNKVTLIINIKLMLNISIYKKKSLKLLSEELKPTHFIFIKYILLRVPQLKLKCNCSPTLELLTLANTLSPSTDYPREKPFV
jgi:hypothetical protein